MRSFLTQYSVGQAEEVIRRWKELGEFLLMKYNDGYVKDENGRPQEVGYPEPWLRKVLELRPGDEKRLVENARRRLERHPDVPEHLASLAEALATTGDPAAAAEYYERALAATRSPDGKAVTGRNLYWAASYASNLESFVQEFRPALWIHGHTHESFDYRIGKTRIVCNPRGYASTAENKKFRPDFTVGV